MKYFIGKSRLWLLFLNVAESEADWADFTGAESDTE